MDVPPRRTKRSRSGAVLAALGLAASVGAGMTGGAAQASFWLFAAAYVLVICSVDGAAAAALCARQ